MSYKFYSKKNFVSVCECVYERKVIESHSTEAKKNFFLDLDGTMCAHALYAIALYLLTRARHVALNQTPPSRRAGSDDE